MVVALAGVLACSPGDDNGGGSIGAPPTSDTLLPTDTQLPTETLLPTAEPTAGGSDTAEPSTGVTAPPTTRPPATSEPPDPRQEELDRQRRKLRAGTIAYRAPEPMRVGESQRVAVRVTDGSAPPDTSALPGTGPPTVDPALVGPDVKAVLTGTDFDIEPVGDNDRRVLVTGGHAEWAWDVRPRRSGHLRLEVTLYVLLSDGSTPIEVRTYDRSVEVPVDTWREVRSWLKEWLPYTGLTLPVLVGGVWALLRRRTTTRKAPPRRPPRRVRSGSRRG